jgi:hypothetical protein
MARNLRLRLALRPLKTSQHPLRKGTNPPPARRRRPGREKSVCEFVFPGKRGHAAVAGVE